jgi:hypothetical protein
MKKTSRWEIVEKPTRVDYLDTERPSLLVESLATA